MKVGDLVMAKDDYGNVKKDEICKIQSFKANLVYVEYKNKHWYVFQFKDAEEGPNFFIVPLYPNIFDIFYSSQEIRKMKLKKLSKKKYIYKLKTRIIRRL